MSTNAAPVASAALLGTEEDGQRLAVELSARHVLRRFHAELGRRLRRARTARGWTQMRLAAEVGLSQDAVSLYERGRRTMRVDTLVAVAQALNVPLSSLLEIHPDVVVIRDTALAGVVAHAATSPERLRAFYEVWDFITWRSERQDG
jgi:transcriptional regulator with XRE-family HTH domain